jgi:uncharacterized protein (DUF2267 family)
LVSELHAFFFGFFFDTLPRLPSPCRSSALRNCCALLAILAPPVGCSDASHMPRPTAGGTPPAPRLTPMNDLELDLRVKDRAGLQTTKEASRALAAVLGALRCALDDQDARSLAAALPSRVARAVHRSPPLAVGDRDALFAEAARRERVRIGNGREHAQAVLEILAQELDPELVSRLRKRLPTGIASLLAPRSSRVARMPEGIGRSVGHPEAVTEAAAKVE